ncbi:MAG: non-canonical purine NTP pyrophosphatase, partial [bacterium]|nr:non-canonical purine NTP pyrophosphatase [bacterium]
MELIVATGNQNKLAEIRRIFGDDFRWTLKSLKDVGFSGEEPEETESDFEGNALLKARYYQNKLGGIVIADDSGIECDDLDGYPGVHSARIGNDDSHRRQVLLTHLKDVGPNKHEYAA